MNTDQLYYEDSTMSGFSAEVVALKHLRGNAWEAELDRTAFYPEGGGQPSDQGTITGPNGTLAVKITRNRNGNVIHEGALTGELSIGEEVQGEVKWPRRQKYMRIHTAGHLLHDVLVSKADGLEATKGRHGDKAFLEYRGEVDDAVVSALGAEVNAAVAADLPVRSWESSLDELEELCASLPPNLPLGKSLRAIQIGDFEPMPDGGVHVLTTKEIGEVVIHHVTVENGTTMIRYGVK